MKKDDKASISLQKVIAVGIILIFLMGITVFAVNSKVTNVKIILSNGYEITVLTSKSINCWVKNSCNFSFVLK